MSTETTIDPLAVEAELHAELRRLSAKRGDLDRERVRVAHNRDALKAKRDHALRDDDLAAVAEIDAELARAEVQLGRPGRQSIDPRLGGTPPIPGDLAKRIGFVESEREQIREQLVQLHIDERPAFIERARLASEAEVEAARAAAEALRQYVAAAEANVAQWRDAYIGTDPSEVMHEVYGGHSHTPGGAWTDRCDVTDIGQRSRGRDRATVSDVIARLVPTLAAVDGLPPIERPPLDAYADHIHNRTEDR